MSRISARIVHDCGKVDDPQGLYRYRYGNGLDIDSKIIEIIINHRPKIGKSYYMIEYKRRERELTSREKWASKSPSKSG